MRSIVSAQRFLEDKDNITDFAGLTCWLLYSDLHTDLWKYVRKNWWALDRLSGDTCLICLMDKPSHADDSFWEEAKFQLALENVPTDIRDVKPFDRNGHIEIASKAGIAYGDMPALAFFSSPEGKITKVLSIENWDSEKEITSFFEDVFWCCKQAVEHVEFGRAVSQADRVERREQALDQLGVLLRRRSIKNIASRSTLIEIAKFVMKIL